MWGVREELKGAVNAPVGQAEGEQLKTGRLEEEVAVLVGEVGDAGDPVAEVPDDVDGGGEQVVELGDLHSLVLHQARLGLQLLLTHLDKLKRGQFCIPQKFLQFHPNSVEKSQFLSLLLVF